MLRFSILPLTTVAALTPPDYEVDICDENVEALNFDHPADVVGISFMTALAPRAYEIAREFRKRGKITVAGGYHPTFMPEEAGKYFDCVVCGDAEELWPKVLDDIAAGTPQRIYRHRELPDLAGSPPPSRKLMRKTAKHYATVNAIQTGRGCSHGCRYCSVTAFHRTTYRHKPVESVILELRQTGRNFIFVDDNIIADREFAMELFEAMAPMKKRWVTQCSVEIAEDPELLKAARKAGCRGIFIGLETLNEENLRSMDKGFNRLESYREKIRKIHRAGIGIIAGVIVGMDADDKGTFERTLRFLNQTGIESIQVNIFTPLPGTPLFEKLNGGKRILDHNWQHYDFRHVVFDPRKMSRAELQAGADWLYRQFYLPHRIMGRFLRTWIRSGFFPAWTSMLLNFTYLYDNIRENIRGRNPAAESKSHLIKYLSLLFNRLHYQHVSRVK